MEDLKYRSLLHHLQKDERLLVYILGFFVLIFLIFSVNILFIDVSVFKKQNEQHTIVMSQVASEKPTPTPTTSVIIATPTLAPQIKNNTANTTAKEYFVPFGTGINSSSDWTDVPGTQAYVDTTAYGKIAKALFEASVSVTTNESVSVRLFDKTDQHPVWYSEVNMPSGTSSELLLSQPIVLEQGNKLYQVQMNTQLQAPATLVQARLHITTD